MIGAHGRSRWDPWRARRPADTLGLRLLLGAGAVLAAYHYSLLTLVRDVGLDTPLAYLGLVPLVALGIAVVLSSRPRTGPEIHDRQLDLILGLPLVLGTVVVLHVVPQQLSAQFWTARLDLLTLPVFVTGVCILLVGLRTTWHYHLPIAFLFLAWPLPYTILIDRTLQLTTDTTIVAVRTLLHVVPAAVPAGGDGSLFRVLHDGTGGSFTVSIASACAGVNSLVGFALVGSAFLAVVGIKRGRHAPPAGRGVARKALWLALGLLLVWCLNVARLMIVLCVGKVWGKAVAIDGLHPVIGLLTFTGAVLLALLVLPLFKLQTGTPYVARASARPSAWQRVRGIARTRPVAAKGLRLASISVLTAAALLLGINSSFAHYELLAGDLSSVRRAGFAQQPAFVPGFAAIRLDRYDWVRQFFGADATWDRFQYSAVGPRTADQPADGPIRPVIVDAIDGTSLHSFNAYGIEACYKFHGYQTTAQERVDLGHGVFGGSIAFQDPRRAAVWDVVFWVWPVQTRHGRRYERVVLLQQNGQNGVLAAPNSNPFQGVGVAEPIGPAVTAQQHAVDEASLAHFARQIIEHQAAAAGAAPTVA